MPEMRNRLREATQAAHERMHAHDGFAAAAAGSISLDDYRDLLTRLYRFHAAFDEQMASAPEGLAREIDLPARARAGLIAEDLRGLGAEPEGALCEDLPSLRTEGAYLGALYVVEGSTLGGVFIARALAPVVGENRRFFLGHGGEHSRLWRGFLARLETLDPAQAGEAERAAVATFDVFERWMKDWRSISAETANA